MIARKILPNHNLKQVTLPGRRYYQDGKGNEYDSVTTVLSDVTDQSGLKRWENQIGKDEANRIRGTAARRGTRVHDSVERYLLGEQDYLRDAVIVDYDAINKLIKHIEENVSFIFGIEHQMYSKSLRAAGTSDLIGIYKGRLTILDYKNSKKLKKEQYVQNYYFQGTAYGIMLEELHNIKPTDIAILVAVDHEPLQIFHKKIVDYREEVTTLFSQRK